MLKNELIGYPLFAMALFGPNLMMAALFIAIGLYFWIVAARAEKRGEMIEIQSVGQTTYRQPWLNKLFATVCFAFAALLIIVGILW